MSMDQPLPETIAYQDNRWMVKHAINPDDSPVYLAHLILEPMRYVESMDELTTDESQQFGLLLSRFSDALKAVQHAEHVYMMLVGHHNPKLHIHLFPRYPNTPREFWFTRMDEWEDAPKGDLSAIADVCRRLKHYYETTYP